MSMSPAVIWQNMDTALQIHFSWFTLAEKAVGYVAFFPLIINNPKQSIHRPLQIIQILAKITLTVVALKTLRIKDPSEALVENSKHISLVREVYLYSLGVTK